MGTVFNKKELLVLLQDFHCLTGLRSAVFDSYGIEVLAYPPELPAYCRLIRSVPDGKTGCYLCDQAACRKATRQKQTIIYPCHAGLIEVITPVQIDGAVVGFLLLSHIVQGADEQSEWNYAQKCCSAYAIDKTALQKAYNALLRIQKAMKLLCDTNLSNAQICQQIGFLDDNYFYRVFRKQTGLTPRQYRDSILADTAKTE